MGEKRVGEWRRGKNGNAKAREGLQRTIERDCMGRAGGLCFMRAVILLKVLHRAMLCNACVLASCVMCCVLRAARCALCPLCHALETHSSGFMFVFSPWLRGASNNMCDGWSSQLMRNHRNSVFLCASWLGTGTGMCPLCHGQNARANVTQHVFSDSAEKARTQCQGYVDR